MSVPIPPNPPIHPDPHHYGGVAAPQLSPIQIIEVPDSSRLDAAARLMVDQHPDPYQAGSRFLEAAAILGLDTSLMWGVCSSPSAMDWLRGHQVLRTSTTSGAASKFSQAIMAVIGSGRTAMLFLSPQPHTRSLWKQPQSQRNGIETVGAQGLRERLELIKHACRELVRPGPKTANGISLVQALLEPPSTELVAAYLAAGFQRLGDLAYMRRDFPRESSRKPTAHSTGPGVQPQWPDGLRVQSVAELLAAGTSLGEVDAMTMTALEKSYIDTLDCPELCGLRSPEDVLISHRSVGQFDPRLWWLVLRGEQALGCVLLNPNRETDSVELVYLGISPEIRGLGLGEKLMRMAMDRLHGVCCVGVHAGRPSESSPLPMTGHGGITCAVDVRNIPAMKLYQRLGFSRVGLRIPFVKGLHP